MVLAAQNFNSLLLLLLQVWFDRRTNYTRSLAVMSMVGYILGLGDRSATHSAPHSHSSPTLLPGSQLDYFVFPCCSLGIHPT